MAGFDVASILAGLRDMNQGLQQDEAAVAETSDNIRDLKYEQGRNLEAAARDKQLEVLTVESGELAREQQNAKNMQALGVADIMAELAPKLRQQFDQVQRMDEEITRKENISFWDNPFEFIAAQTTLDQDINTRNQTAESLNQKASMIQTVNDLAQEAAATTLANKQIRTSASIEATARLAAMEFTNKALDAKISAGAVDLNKIEQLSKLNDRQLDNLIKGRQIEISEEQLGMQRAEFLANQNERKIRLQEFQKAKAKEGKEAEAELKMLEIFTDYDFDGSALSVILDVLAFNTHYNALYTNMAVNESFLDSASKYSSVVSHAKALGYTARSVRSARAKLNLTLTNNIGSLTYTIPRGTVFKTAVGDNEFDFILDSDYTAPLVNGVYSFQDVTIVEGTPATRSIPVTITSEFVIPNRAADISTLLVKVQESAGSSVFRTFTFANNALDVGPDSEVFFVKQREDLFYEIYFGDGNVGVEIVPGNIVHMEYMISSGPTANAARLFTYSSGIVDSFTDLEIQTVLPAAGGADAESIESIRFNAPRLYAAQNRAVTANDYIAIVNQLFPSVETVTVWGGQENIPKVYGKVFIAAKPNGADSFSEQEKTEIRRVLLQKAAVVSVVPEIVDPLYLRIELVTNVYYNPKTARRSPGEISTSVRNNVANFASTLGKFGSEFRFSKLVRQIDSSDDSIVSNITTLRVRRTVRVGLNLLANQ